jgi:Uma2 family endonuclease
MTEMRIMAADSTLFSGSMDVDTFMAFAMTTLHREYWELIEGVAVRKEPATYPERRITVNLCDLLNTAPVAQQLCLLSYVNVAVRCPGMRNFQPVPDVSAVPGPARDEYYSERFQLVAKLLSPSNTRMKIGIKLRYSCEAPANLYAVVIEPLAFMVEIYAKSRKWDRMVLERSDDVLEMPEFGLRCFVADLYRGTELDPEWVD